MASGNTGETYSTGWYIAFIGKSETDLSSYLSVASIGTGSRIPRKVCVSGGGEGRLKGRPVVYPRHTHTPKL